MFFDQMARARYTHRVPHTSIAQRQPSGCSLNQANDDVAVAVLAKPRLIILSQSSVRRSRSDNRAYLVRLTAKIDR